MDDAATIQEAEREAREWREHPDADYYEYLIGEYGPHSEIITAHERRVLNAVSNAGRYVPDRLTLTGAHERDQRLYGEDRDEKAFDYAVASFVSIVGNKDIREIHRADVAEWIAEIGKSQAPTTVKRRLGALRAMTNRTFLDFDISRRNPFERHKIKGG